MAEKVVMEYLLGDGEFIGCLNRSRPVGEKPTTGDDTRKRIRFSWKYQRPVALTTEQASSNRQRFLDLQAVKYLNVEMAKKFRPFGGKSEGDLTEEELLALDGQTIIISDSDIDAFMMDFDSETAVERGSIESEYKAAAAYFRNVKEDAAKQAKEAGDTARAEKLTAEAKEFSAAYVKAVYLGTYTGKVETSDARTKAIKKKVDSIKKTSDGDAEI